MCVGQTVLSLASNRALTWISVSVTLETIKLHATFELEKDTSMGYPNII
jgi:hypothetical protein